MSTQNRIIEYEGPAIPEIVPEISYAEYILDLADQHGDATAAIMTDTKEEVTFAELVKRCRSFAAGLQQKLGLSKGQFVAIALPNCIEFPVSTFGVVLCGATASFVNPLYKPRELEHVINVIQPTLWICIPEFVNSLRASSNYANEKIIVIGSSSSPDCISWDDIIAEGDWSKFNAPEVNVKEDVATMPFSSGTSGLPKGVMLTHYNLVAAHCQLKIWVPYRKGSRLMSILPFFHQYGCKMVTSCMALGSTMIIMRRFGFLEFLQAIQDYKVTDCPLVPPIALLLCKNPAVNKFDLSSLENVTSSAAPLSVEVIDELTKKFNCTLTQGYGMTECSLATHITPHGYTKRGTVGQVMPYWHVKITDPATGQVLGPNEPGEICVKGPMIMKGYRGDPGSTAALIDSEGWLHTGDIGLYDDDKWFFIKDRIKEVIKFKGFQVAPSELEHLLLTIPDVVDAAVVGVPDEEAGEVPRAFVVKHSDSNITEKEIQDYVADQVAPYKKLRGGVVFIKAVPKSASGKILRRELRSPNNA